MERPKVDVWDTIERLPPATGEFRTPTTDRLAHARLRSTRLRWYLAAALAAGVAALATDVIFRATGAYYPFISGFAMVACVAGGAGPTLVGGLGSLLLAHLIPPVGSMIPTESTELVRLGANALLLVAAGGLSGLFRRSRLATFERESRLERAASAVRELLDESSDGIALTDSDLRLTYVNARAEQMFGFQPGGAIGKTVQSLVTPESLASTPLKLQALYAGQTVRSERSAFRANGTVIDVDLSARLLSGGRLLISLRDMSESRREAERQRAQRDLLSGIMATSVAGIIMVDPRGTILFANQRAEALLDLVKRGDHTSTYDRPHWRLVGIDGTRLAPSELPFRRVIATDAPVFDERIAMQWPDGRRTALTVNGGPLHDATGQLQAVVLAFNDITGALAAEHALRERDRQLEQITEAMPGIVYQFLLEADGRQRFVYVSRYSVQMIDREPEVLLRDVNAAWELMHPDDLPSTQQSIMESAQSMKAWIHEFRMKDTRQEGAWRWVSGRALPCQGPTPGSVLWNGIFIDITDRRVLEDDLRQAQKIESVGRLAGSIAHDFNNLLTVILGQAELLSMELAPGTEHAEGVAQIRAAAESGSALTRQLLGFARRQVVAPQVVELNALVQRVPPLVGRLLGEGVTLHLALTADELHVRVDPAQFDQVLVNLAVNARDAMPEGGRVELRTRLIAADAPGRSDFTMLRAGPLAEISVRDSGVGMPETVRNRAFEPFFTTKGIGKGTGLGLATSYGIVAQAGGTIVLDSILGQGTTVRVLLPVTPDAVTAAERRQRLTHGTGDETVLVVDDDRSVRGVTASALRRQGYRVLEAASGQEALDIARGLPSRIHLLVTDVVMPRMTGPELAHALTRERPDMRVLFVSGYAEGAMSPQGVLDDGIALLAKPYDIGELAQRVRDLLESPV